MGPNLARLLNSYWDQQRVLPKTGKFLGKEFCTGRGLTQGDLASTMIFDMVVDSVVWGVLDVVYGSQEAQHGLGWLAGVKNLILYAGYGRI